MTNPLRYAPLVDFLAKGALPLPSREAFVGEFAASLRTRRTRARRP